MRLPLPLQRVVRRRRRMRNKASYGFIVLAMVVALVALGCGSSTGEELALASDTTVPPTATAEPGTRGQCGDGVCDEAEQANPALCPQDCGTAEPEARGQCGDGVCDEAEQANPALCPQDCQPTEPAPTASPGGEEAPTSTAPPGGEEPPTPTPTSTPIVTPTLTLPPVSGEEEGETGCPPSDWWLIVDGCSDMHGMAEPSGKLCGRFELCMTVDEACQIHGSSQGRYDQSTCFYTSPGGCMAYEVTCPSFPISVGGELVRDPAELPSRGWPITYTLPVTIPGAVITPTPVITPGGGVLPSAPPTPGSWEADYDVLWITLGAVRNGGGYFCVLAAVDGAQADVNSVDIVAPAELYYSFSVELRAGCGGP
jgi:uncharacterized low-complexity protein